MRKLFSSVIAATTIFTSVVPAYANPYQSWINPNVLATDPQTYCNRSDIIAQDVHTDRGSNAQNDLGSNAQNEIGSSNHYYNESHSSASSSESEGGGSGKIGFKFLSLGGGGKKITKKSNQDASNLTTRYENTWDNSSQNTWDNSFQNTWERTDITSKVAGVEINCDAFVYGATQRDIANINADVQREAIKTNWKMQMLNNLMPSQQPRGY